MKQFIIICAMFAGITAKAQTTASSTKWKDNENDVHRTASVSNEFANTAMAVNNGTITFSDVPVVKGATYAVITNSAGEVVKETKVTPEQNTIDIKKLHTGLYFVTIMHKDKSKKAFTLNL